MHTAQSRRSSRTWTRFGNRIGVWLYRRSGGRLSGATKTVHVLLITTPGRRTGLPRSTCVRYLETASGLVVWGTGSGSPRDPDWFENLRAAPTATVQIADRVSMMRPRELLGSDRDALWHDVILEHAPEVARYADKAGRVIPVAVLEPA
jgi:deazaflavin-dependent oxidoreductase (nitroreductase family)